MSRRRKKKNPSTGAIAIMVVGGVVVAGIIVSAFAFSSGIKLIATQIPGGTPPSPGAP